MQQSDQFGEDQRTVEGVEALHRVSRRDSPRDLHARLWDLRRDSPSHLQAREEEEEADTNEVQNHRRKTSQRCTLDLIISAYQCRREYLEIIRVPLSYIFTSRHRPPDRLLRPADTLTVNHPPSFSKVYHLFFTCDW